MDTPVLLVANRGEIALRIISTATELGFATVAIYSSDDADLPHVRAATRAVQLPGDGPAAYLDAPAIVAAAQTSGAGYVHPGYGFLSENADFALACDAAGLQFVGPSPTILRTLADKVTARDAALAADVPVAPATAGAATLDQITTFFADHPGGIMIKALAGGGGRGMRPVFDAADLDASFARCTAEAQLAVGDPAVFAEVLINNARHIEVQVVAAPGFNGVTHALALGDRDCSLQRRNQKILEIAPAQQLSNDIRARLHSYAARLCARLGYHGIATVEFLVTNSADTPDIVFLEVNPRIQVEHTITEETTGVDLVATQLNIATGTGFDALALPDGVTSDGVRVDGHPATPTGIAVQTRVNLESLRPDGSLVPTSGTLTAFAPPTGRGIRVDTYGFAGLSVSARYDSLLAKVITHVRTQSFSAALCKASTALNNFTIAGVETNVGLLRSLLDDETVRSGIATTSYLESALASFDRPSQQPASIERAQRVEAGQTLITSPMLGTVVHAAEVGSQFPSGGEVVVIEAMKMQHPVTVEFAAQVVSIVAAPGQTVNEGDPLIIVAETGAVDVSDTSATLDLDRSRDDLDEVLSRHRVTLDAARPEAVAKRRKLNRRTARENIADLVDYGSFVEYGGLAIAAQRTRRSDEDLIANTPADGLIAGVATIGVDRFGDKASRAAVLSYDYTVLAGTQGMRNHAKTDRLLDVATRQLLPVVLFAEGGGGRPGDTDVANLAGLDVPTFRSMAALSGKVPTVAIVSGRCFAGNAALAGVCDIIIATPDANIGMGGPAMIEGGGLGTVRPEDIGPIDVQRRNGVVDVVAHDEADAVRVATAFLSYFQGDVEDWEAPDPRLSRHAVPENRLRAYDIRAAIDSIIDVGSGLELHRDYGVGVITTLARVEGTAYGVIANSSHHLGGAIDAEAADKLADFLRLCDSRGLPIVSLCDTPGFMVGPTAEEEATVRRFSALFIVGAQLSVPVGMVILRKGYGLGAMAMGGGSFHAPDFTIAWPTGEIGGMGLEGAVRLGFAKELAAVEDTAERDKLFEQLVAMAYAHGKALTSASTFELDDVIDPAETRSWIVTLGRR